MLQIYNTLTKNKEIFTPINPGQVGIYVCGSTVYDYCHIGHGRVFVCFDIIVRYLKAIGYKVTYVRNITDIDDKIIKRAQDKNEDYHSFTQRMIDAMHADEKALGVLSPNFEPKVTETIPEIITLIQTLIDGGFAYKTSAGDVYFEVSKFEKYGELAQQNLDDLKAGTRVETTEQKRAPLDFALWKSAKPGEPYWESPWDDGRPGWHIECSAMSKKYLGPHIDIHGGGSDLQFPHHQNELAQSEAANCCKFVNFWMHLGFVQVNHEKMSKSLGNFSTIKDVLKTYQPEVLRYFYIASHYRSQVNYSTENLDSANVALQRLYLSLRGLPNTESTNATETESFKKKFYEAMDDDFNTPEALAVLFELAREINKLRDDNNLEKAAIFGNELRELGKILGILQNDSNDFLHAGVDETKIRQLIDERNAARKNKNWALADEIRNKLTEMKIAIEDTANGTIWRNM